MFPIGVYQCGGVVVLLFCVIQTSNEVIIYMYMVRRNIKALKH